MSLAVSGVGRWLADGIYQDQEGLWFSERYLEQYREVVPPDNWIAWTKYSCADLDLTVNGGRIRSKLAHAPCGRPPRVYFQNDVDQIVRRRTEATERRTDPAQLGRWLSEDIFQMTRELPHLGLQKGNILLTEERLLTESRLTH